ncbi:uncharacterized protein RB166_012304 [Leptodactylus fuscus]|uniref:uncharacterized protein LOC142210212 n=1 Tax=Leptodactylus fuscus TaxID=238119 RepID=UPI003F4E83B7
MKDLTGLACLLLVLVHPGHCLNCTQYFHSTDILYTGPEVTCAANQDVCFSTSIQYSGSSDFIYFRDCGISQTCDSSFSYAYINVMINCCKENDCTTPVPTFVGNGFQCLTLYAPVNYTARVMQCKGDQNKCFNLTDTPAKGGKTVVAGCANENFCSKFIMNRTDITCQNAISNLPTTATTTSTTRAPSTNFTVRPPSTNFTKRKEALDYQNDCMPNVITGMNGIQ